MTAIMGILGVIVWITGYFQWSMSLASSVKIGNRIKKKYLAAILRQDCPWFDQINYTELSARVSKEVLSMQRAIGEKLAAVINAYAMSLSGFALGFF